MAPKTNPEQFQKNTTKMHEALEGVKQEVIENFPIPDEAKNLTDQYGNKIKLENGYIDSAGKLVFSRKENILGDGGYALLDIRINVSGKAEIFDKKAQKILQFDTLQKSFDMGIYEEKFNYEFLKNRENNVGVENLRHSLSSKDRKIIIDVLHEVSSDMWPATRTSQEILGKFIAYKIEKVNKEISKTKARLSVAQGFKQSFAENGEEHGEIQPKRVRNSYWEMEKNRV